MIMNQKIILASASPRRRELLAQIGLEFEVKVSNKEEVYTSTKPQKIVEELALMKAENVASDLQAEGVELKNTIVSEEEIRAYIATGDPMDKAGAYGIQGSFAAYIDGIEGDYYNVVGLPVSYVYQQLKKR